MPDGRSRIAPTGVPTGVPTVASSALAGHFPVRARASAMFASAFAIPPSVHTGTACSREERKPLPMAHGVDGAGRRRLLADDRHLARSRVCRPGIRDLVRVRDVRAGPTPWTTGTLLRDGVSRKGGGLLHAGGRMPSVDAETRSNSRIVTPIGETLRLLSAIVRRSWHPRDDARASDAIRSAALGQRSCRTIRGAWPCGLDLTRWDGHPENPGSCLGMEVSSG